MDDLPLNAVENKRDHSSQPIGTNSNICIVNLADFSVFFLCTTKIFAEFWKLKLIGFISAKSPYKLSTTEKRVIGGLQKLTELLFKQHFKPNANEGNMDNGGPVQSDENAMSVDYSTTNGTANMYADKENTDENPPDEAEVFCGMVVQQLTTSDPNEQKEDWHRGQLNAYNWAHDKLFDKKWCLRRKIHRFDCILDFSV